MIQGQLLAYAVLALAERGNPTPHRCHMLPDGQVEALDERGVALAAKGSQPGIDGLQGTKHHAMPHVDQTAPAHRLDHLRIQQCGPRHPARLGRWPLCSLAGRLHPLAAMGEERGGVLLEAVGQEEWYTVRG